MLNNIVLHLPHTGSRYVCEQGWCVRVCAHFVYIVRIGEFQEWGINKNFGVSRKSLLYNNNPNPGGSEDFCEQKYRL